MRFPRVTAALLGTTARALPPVLLAGAAACGGGDLALPNEGQPSELEVVRGDRQNGTIGEALADSLVVRVLDRFGDPVRGAEVTWTPETGGSVNPPTSTTSSNGMAGTQLVLGGDVGTYVTTAAVAGVDEGPEPVVFTTTGVAARLAFLVEPPATGTSGVPLDPQPVLQLQDALGADIAREGVIVTAQISAGGGSLDGGTSATSDAAGRVAFVDLGLRGSPATRTLIFAADGFAPATASVALGVGAPAAIAAAAGDEQSAVVAMAVPIAPAVLVSDEDGNPLAGIPVSFKVTGGGGSVQGGSPLTGSDGIATVSGWRLGEKAGANTLEARLSGLTVSGSPVVFTATATPGPVSAEKSLVQADPTSITASDGSSRSTITVTARDGFENPIPGLAVTLAASGSGNSLTQPAQPTASDGSATGQLSAVTPGERVVSARIAGTAVTQTATVQVVVGAPVAARSSATVPDGTAGEPTTIEIRLADAQGNPAAGFADAIAVSVTGANAASPARASDEGGGRYTVSYTPTTSGTDQVQVSVSGTRLQGSPFASSVEPGPAAGSHSVAQVPSRLTIFQLPVVVRITAFDRFGNRVTRGGDEFRVRANNGELVAPRDNGDGTYTAQLNLGTGVYLIHILLNGTEIEDSPHQVIITFF